MYLEEVSNEAIQEPLLPLSNRTEQVLSERKNRNSGPTIIPLVSDDEQRHPAGHDFLEVASSFDHDDIGGGGNKHRENAEIQARILVIAQWIWPSTLVTAGFLWQVPMAFNQWSLADYFSFYFNDYVLGNGLLLSLLWYHKRRYGQKPGLMEIFPTLFFFFFFLAMIFLQMWLLLPMIFIIAYYAGLLAGTIILTDGHHVGHDSFLGDISVSSILPRTCGGESAYSELLLDEEGHELEQLRLQQDRLAYQEGANVRKLKFFCCYYVILCFALSIICNNI